MIKPLVTSLGVGVLLVAAGCRNGSAAGGAASAGKAQPGTAPTSAPTTQPALLFPTDSLEGWHVSNWADVATPQQVAGQAWKIERGLLQGLGRRTWLFSEAEFADFALSFDVTISPGANGGLGLRFPPGGDPAYKGLEIQIVDHEVYYRGQSQPQQRTGSIYDEIAADNAPGCINKWTSWQVTARGSRITVTIDGRKVLDADLSQHTQPRQQKGPALAERPLKGRIGFQNLSGLIAFRNLRIAKL